MEAKKAKNVFMSNTLCVFFTFIR